jgi:hypothetical protein
VGARRGEERGVGGFLIVDRLDALGAWCGVFGVRAIDCYDLC